RGTKETNGLKYKTEQQGEPMTNVTRQSGENTEEVWVRETKRKTRPGNLTKTQTQELKTKAGMKMTSPHLIEDWSTTQGARAMDLYGYEHLPSLASKYTSLP
ncbi:hypothetical protein CHARACLAT_018044, partial [Characodon lateralis]|nr:hypothetical protein [Characodon lateralis]